MILNDPDFDSYHDAVIVGGGRVFGAAGAEAAVEGGPAGHGGQTTRTRPGSLCRPRQPGRHCGHGGGAERGGGRGAPQQGEHQRDRQDEQVGQPASQLILLILMKVGLNLILLT